MALVLTITAAGRAALVNAQNTGTAPVTIARVGVSPQALAPTAATAALPGEIKRIATISGDVVADDTIHLIVRDETSDVYTIRSFALYLGDGTLFAAYGQADPIMEKSAQSLLLLAIDVRFVDIAAPDLTFGDTAFINPPATVDRQGVVELATDAEATDGTDAVRAVTPRGAKAAVTAWLDSRFGDGAPSAFMKGLLLSASAVAFRASLAIKSAALKDEGAGNGLDADLLDGQHGAWYADIPARLGYTPWHLNNDGAGSGLDADLLDGQQGSYYLPAAAYTAADVLAKLKTVDGAGSGLDADLLDGKEGAAFALLAGGAGAAFTGPISSTGLVTCGGGVRGTGSSGALTGAGVQVGYSAASAAGFVESYDYAAAAYAPLNIDGSAISIRPGGIARGVFSATGLAVTGNVGSTSSRAAGTSGFTTGAGVETFYNTSTTTGYIVAYDRDAATSRALRLQGSSVSIRGNGDVGIADFTTTGLAVTGLLTLTGALSSGGGLVAKGTALNGLTGPGALVQYGGGQAYFGAYSDNFQTLAGVQVDGSYINLRVGNVTIAGLTASGLSVTGAITRNGFTVWDAGNDGSGSGLDADLLDGQHGSYYLPAATYTAADVLAKLKTVDGAGTGLDADLLDGQHADWLRDWINLLNKPASFPPSAHQHTAADIAGAFTGSLTQNGWVVLPNGLIIQWGRFTASANTTTRVNFPLAFPTAGFAASANGGANGGADSSDNPPVLLGDTVDRFGFTVFSADDTTTRGGYIAIGI